MQVLEVTVLFKLFFFGIVIDFITGVLVAAKEGKLRSRTCSNGIFRSIGEFVVLCVFMIFGNTMPEIHAYLGVFMIGFILKEGISICENLVKLDVWIPNALKEMLEVGVDKIDNADIGKIKK